MDAPTIDLDWEFAIFRMARSVWRTLFPEKEISLSPAAVYVSGETLRVDGAGSLWRKQWEIADHDELPPFHGLA